MAPLQGDTPSGASGEWRHALHDTARASPRFVPDAQLRTPWRQTLDVEGVVARVASVSFVAGLDPVDRGSFLDQVRAEARRYPAPLAFPYVTEIFTYRRAG
jgi:hypothetical protein